MAKLTIHGEDFARGDGWYYSPGCFVLLDKNGRPESIPLAEVLAVDHATESALWEFGASVPVVSELVPVLDVSTEPTFVAIFRDGRLLVASTDVKSFEEIYAWKASDSN